MCTILFIASFHFEGATLSRYQDQGNIRKEEKLASPPPPEIIDLTTQVTITSGQRMQTEIGQVGKDTLESVTSLDELVDFLDLQPFGTAGAPHELQHCHAFAPEDEWPI